MPQKRYLTTPGPTPVPPEVLAALAEPMIHHRGRDFRDTYRRCLWRLRAVQALAAVAHEAEALVVVDAISSLGAVPLETDAWGIDVVVSGSQKALMCPPGLAFTSVSPAALDAAAHSASPRYALDWERTRAGQAKLDAPFTPAVSIVKALDVALGLVLDEGP